MSEASTKPKTSSRPRGRSPGYPAVDLPTALDRANKLWLIERQHFTPVETAMKHWGYNGLSGRAGLTLAALIKFGLLEDQGSRSERKVKVTDLAIRIMNHPDDVERTQAIRDAALTPAIHEMMWNTFGRDLPSDRSLLWTLEQEHDFTESGAREFLKEYRSTIEFAGLMKGLSAAVEPAQAMGPAPEASTGASREYADPALFFQDYPKASVISRMRGGETLVDGVEIARPIDIPLPGNKYVTVTSLFPLSEAEWNQFLAVLNVMKPGLVQH